MPNTQSQEVNLTKRVQTPRGMRYCSIVLGSTAGFNGRIRPDVVRVNGRPERHSDGSYYLECREKGRRIRLSVGKDAQDAAACHQRKEAELRALNNGVPVLAEPGDRHRSVAAAVADFLEETELTKKPKTLAAYTTALNYFTESCRKLYLHEIERYDLLKFAGFLRDEKKQSPRSVYNKFETVMGFLKANGIRGLVGKNDWPRYTEEEPEMYEQEELDKLFNACNEEERLWFEFFLMTGMREQEVMHTYWSDVNFAASTVRVSHKFDRNWTPKAYKEREIPIPAKLAKKLKAWKAKSDKNCDLVFPTAGFGDPGDDQGAQWIMAHPISADTQAPAQLTVNNFTKELHYQIGQVQQNGDPVYRYFEPYCRYSVTVTNTGTSGVFFNVQGGGNT